jgi:hypothetical protein
MKKIIIGLLTLTTFSLNAFAVSITTQKENYAEIIINADSTEECERKRTEIADGLKKNGKLVFTYKSDACRFASSGGVSFGYIGIVSVFKY